MQKKSFHQRVILCPKSWHFKKMGLVKVHLQLDWRVHQTSQKITRLNEWKGGIFLHRKIRVRGSGINKVPNWYLCTNICSQREYRHHRTRQSAGYFQSRPSSPCVVRVNALTPRWFKYKYQVTVASWNVWKEFFSWAILNISSLGLFNVWINYGTAPF